MKPTIRFCSGRMRTSAVVLIASGALFLALAWVGATRAHFLVDALAYVATGGLGGVFCIALGSGLLIAANSSDLCRDLDRLEAALRSSPVAAPAATVDPMTAPATTNGWARVDALQGQRSAAG